MPSESTYRSAVRDYIRTEAKPVEKYSHQPRLYALTRLVGQNLAYDDDVVFAAAWLHDLGVFADHRPEDIQQLSQWDSVAYACQKAPGILERLGFPQSKIPAVVEAIRTHQPGADPRRLEGTILRDADILEQLGAVGVLRAVCKIGRDTRYPTFSDVILLLRQAVRDLPGHLRLETARELAKERVAILENFLRSVEKESAGELD